MKLNQQKQQKYLDNIKNKKNFPRIPKNKNPINYNTTNRSKIPIDKKYIKEQSHGQIHYLSQKKHHYAHLINQDGFYQKMH